MLDVRRLRLLRDLSQLGTIAAVAKIHTYTPSAVSQQLAALEREAGVALLERSGRRVVLTPAGAVLAKHAETVLSALEEAGAAVAAAGNELSGPLHIGAFPTAVRTLLPEALVTLGRDHPRLELMVTELDPADAPEALRERRLDVALIHDYDVLPTAGGQGLEESPLLEETVFLAVRAGSGFAGIHSAADAAWIAGTPGTVCHAVTLQLCHTAGFSPRIRHYADDFAAVLALVAAGQGVSLVPQLAAADPPSGVRLLPLGARRRTRIAHRSGAAGHPAVIAFTEAVRASTAGYLAH
ncbi:DNA-binding transcriptional LysR family regulator [Kribbella voronezhensis]|uniref:DNA-binding transcriptional LysR family regulator n=1 Tax=Kribbella voronezhensis TaxID=2512212 RepID=A0A4R7SY98_9ACTN|nr:LysR family transcriptional regulator [Kribbella voronezhensis]TDU84360.1 DNA-binding transcriptional LysR family regulator [Kribbella voronezhensis]